MRKPIIRLLVVLAVVGLFLVRAATTPQYTAADAKRFAVAHPISGKIQPQGSVGIAAVYRLTRDEASEQLGYDLGRAVTAAYVVEWRGAFLVSTPLGTTIMYPKAYQLLDAQSGQLLAETARE
jgi:hypothetical protein